MKKRIVIILVLVIAFATTGYIFLKKDPSSKAIEWETKSVERGSITNTITATGTLEAVTTVQVGTQVSGIINHLYIDYNTKVKKGQVIAQIDTTTLSANLFDTRASVYRQQIQVNQSKRNFDRVKALFDEKVVAQIEYDQALDDLETAKSALISAEAQLKRAELNLAYATIRAPIEGVVISKSVEQGQTVAASLNSPTLFTIANDLTKMQVQASVDEADIGQVKQGQEVTFNVDAYPEDKFTGSVKQIRLQPVITSNVVNYIVIVDVPNPDLKLMPGMTASITVKVNEANDVLKVPAKALSFRPPDFYLNDLMSHLPDSTKERINERVGAIEKRMKESGSTDAEIKQRIESMRVSFAFGGPIRSGGGQRGGFMFGGPGAGDQGRARTRPSNVGQLWVMDGNKLRLIRVSTGLRDGTNVSVEGEEIKDSMVVVTGALYDKELDNTAQSNNNPLMPGRMGGRGYR